MKKKHIRDTPVIKVAEGYDLEEVMDAHRCVYFHQQTDDFA